MGGGFRSDRPNYTKSISQINHTLKEFKSDYNSGPDSTKRVFISFHMDDEQQVDLLRHQAKDPRFDLEFTDYSVKEPFDEKWKTQCTERLKQSSVVVVMIGKETHSREAVIWEIEKAYELGKPVVGVRIHKDRADTIPEPMRRNGAKIVNWKMEEIQNAIDSAKK